MADGAKAWCDKLKTAGLPDEFADVVKKTYTSPDAFRCSFRHEDDIDAYAQCMLKDKGVADDSTWRFHPVTGALRQLRESLCQAANVASTPPSLSALPLQLNSVSSSRLSSADRERLIATFSVHYPGVVLHSSLLPSVGYLHTIQQQCSSKSFAWLPWKRVLSDDAAFQVQSRRTSTRKRDMAELVAEAAGLCDDEWDLELMGSPHKVSKLLTVRAHAYALCTGGGHLHNWMSYVHAFVTHYSKRPGTGMRPVTPAEAEEADREALCEVFRATFQDKVSIDDALTSIVREDCLRVKLAAVPKPLKLPSVLATNPSEKHKGKGRGRGGATLPKRRRLGTCHIPGRQMQPW